MQIDMRTLMRMVRHPKPNDLLIIHRHYCTQMYLNNLCTRKCEKQCLMNMVKAWDYAYGEFVLKPGGGALVFIFREIVGDEVAKARQHEAIIPKNDLGEEQELNPITELTKHYEAATEMR